MKNLTDSKQLGATRAANSFKDYTVKGLNLSSAQLKYS